MITSSFSNFSASRYGVRTRPHSAAPRSVLEKKSIIPILPKGPFIRNPASPLLCLSRGSGPRPRACSTSDYPGLISTVSIASVNTVAPSPPSSRALAPAPMHRHLLPSTRHSSLVPSTNLSKNSARVPMDVSLLPNVVGLCDQENHRRRHQADPDQKMFEIKYVSRLDCPYPAHHTPFRQQTVAPLPRPQECWNFF